ncbi:hypothetical protein BYT27DRAFT_7198870, partial [Phlegmacium glaucopus]
MTIHLEFRIVQLIPGRLCVVLCDQVLQKGVCSGTVGDTTDTVVEALESDSEDEEN